jgi:hypothetical protein
MTLFRQIKRQLMRLDIDWPHSAKSPNGRQYLSDLVEFQRMLAQRDCDKLVEDLNADDPA